MKSMRWKNSEIKIRKEREGGFRQQEVMSQKLLPLLSWSVSIDSLQTLEADITSFLERLDVTLFRSTFLLPMESDDFPSCPLHPHFFELPVTVISSFSIHFPFPFPSPNFASSRSFFEMHARTKPTRHPVLKLLYRRLKNHESFFLSPSSLQDLGIEASQVELTDDGILQFQPCFFPALPGESPSIIPT